MVNPSDITKYLQWLKQKYQQWWKLYTLVTDEEYEPFDFSVKVQTEEPIQQYHSTQRGEKQKILLPVLDGIDRYVDQEHIILAGKTINNNVNIQTLNAKRSAFNLGGNVRDQIINQPHKPEP